MTSPSVTISSEEIVKVHDNAILEYGGEPEELKAGMEGVELPGCHTQGKTVDELMERTKEAIECYLEGEGGDDGKSIVLPVHAGEKIDRSLLKKIIKKDLKMTTEEFLELIE